jgi:hypothetical protein
MIAIGFIAAIVIGGPVFYALGVCHGLDLKRHHEKADIRPALRRSVR